MSVLTTTNAVVKHGEPARTSGRTLRRLLHGRSPAARGRVAAMLVNGGSALVSLSAAQAARLCGTTPNHVCLALGNAGKRGPHRATVDRLLKKYGPETLMRALDHATAPAQAAE